MQDTAYDDFARRLQMLRERKHISRQVASELCGLHPEAFRRYERGERKPSFTALCAIADFFDVTVDYLIGREISAELSQKAKGGDKSG